MKSSPALLLLLGLFACDEGPDLPEDGDFTAPALVIGTLTDGYDVGSLSWLDLTDGTLTDDVISAAPDSTVHVENGLVWVMERLGYDVLRGYEAGTWGAPVVEFSTGTASNPHDVKLCGGLLAVTRYELPTMGLYDPTTGELQAEIDLSPLADDDGIPEMSGMVSLGPDRVAVSLQRMRRNDGWVPAEAGVVAVVDCQALEVVESVQVGPNPGIAAWGADLAVISDEGVARLATDPLGEPEAVWSPVVGQVTGGSFDADGFGLLVVELPSSEHELWCHDPGTNAFDRLDVFPNYLSSVLVTRGEGFVAARRSWTDPEGSGTGVIEVDVPACAPRSQTWVQTHLPPFSLARF